MSSLVPLRTWWVVKVWRSAWVDAPGFSSYSGDYRKIWREVPAASLLGAFVGEGVAGSSVPFLR
jgi:hypothetical protein